MADDQFDEHEHMAPELIHKSWRKFCQHPSIIVDEGRRTMECRLCGKVIDPFDFLKDCAREQNRFRMDREQLYKEILKLTQERDTLKQQVAAARLRLRKLEIKKAFREVGGDHAAE